MRLDEGLPRGLSFSLRGRLDAVFLEDVPHRLVGHLPAEVLPTHPESGRIPTRDSHGRSVEQDPRSLA